MSALPPDGTEQEPDPAQPGFAEPQPPPGVGDPSAYAPAAVVPAGAAPGSQFVQAPPPYPEYSTPGLALAAAPPARGRNWLRIGQLVVAIVLIAAGGISVLLVLGYSGGPAALLVGIGSAIVPVPFLVLCFLWLDRYEPEPTKYLVFCFAWGACFATGGALGLNTGASFLFSKLGLSDNLVAVLVAPFVEETLKASGPLLLFWFRRKAFSGFIDCIVYCGLSATGFAMVENILYLGVKAYAPVATEAGAAAGARAVVATFIARIVLTGFAHPLFTSMTGVGLGFATRATSKGVRIIAPLAGLLVAMMLHGSWNLMTVISAKSQYFLLYGYFAVMVPIFLSQVALVLYLRSSEGGLAERILPDYVRAGWLSPPEVAAMRTIGRRLSARLWAKRVAGDAGATAMKAFQFDATRLALLREGMRRGVGLAPADLGTTLTEERSLLESLTAYRKVFGGRDMAAPRAFWDGVRYHVTFPDGVVRTVEAAPTPVAPLVVPIAPPRPHPGSPYGGYQPGYPGPAPRPYYR
jgi:RsiW-degrading membrane proteinase PrsW (M82 family)